MNLYEISMGNRYGPLLHLQVHCCYEHQFVLFLWQHNHNVLSNFLLILLVFQIEYVLVLFPLWVDDSLITLKVHYYLSVLTIGCP